MLAGGLALVLTLGAGGAADDDPLAPDGAAPERADTPRAVRLVDVFEPSMASAAPDVDAPPATIWRFDGSPVPAASLPRAPAAAAGPGGAGGDAGPPADEAAPEPVGTFGWRAAHEVAELSVVDARLVGRSTGPTPLVHASWEPPRDADDVHAIVVRLSASAGRELAVAVEGRRDLSVPRMLASARSFGWPLTAPLAPGDEPRTYVLRSPYTLSAGETRQLLLRPTDAAGARFAVESVQVVTRREFLAALPAGASRQGLDEVWCESLVARAPQRLTLPLRLPARPVLELELGTPDTRPVTFVVRVDHPGGTSQLLRTSVDGRDAWRPAQLDLAPWAGQDVALVLGLESSSPGALGFWGTPVVRSRVAGPERPPNVLLVVCDTLRADRLDVYGHERETAPALAALAARGVRFDDVTAQATWTKTSVPSLLTGLFPATHGVYRFDDVLPAAARTLAERLRDHGWATVSHASVLFTGRFTRLDQGFEVVHEAASLSRGTRSKTAGQHVDRLLPWIERHRDVPWFVQLHVFDPHDPYRALPPHDGAFADLSRFEQHELERTRARGFITETLRRDLSMPARDDLAAAGVDPQAWSEYELDLYDGSIRGMDAELGRLLEHLRRLGLEDDTLVVFTSDHGEEFFERGRPSHGQGVHVELSHVPLVLAGPGVPAGRVAAAPAMSVDVLPTLLELLGLPGDGREQGRSLVPWLDGAAPAGGAWPERPIVTECAPLDDPLTPPPLGRGAQALRLGRWRLVQELDADGRDGAARLYDVLADPGERVDLAAERPAVLERLRQALARWRERVAGQRLAPDAADEPAGLDAETLQRLRALGYLR